MTAEKIKDLLRGTEGVSLEFKESTNSLSRSVYETICAFLNRKGGYILLGVNDNGDVVGVNPDTAQLQIDMLARDLNNPQLFNPTYYLDFELVNVDDKLVICFYVPESNQAHSYKGRYYDRNQEGDYEVKGTEQIANLFIRKSRIRTENRVFPQFSIDDLDETAFDSLRNSIRVVNPTHPWLLMSNEEILHSGEMYMTDMETGESGITMAAILLFGKKHTIAAAIPFYRIDLLCRINDTELYDDRNIVDCNLIHAYPNIMSFIKKHLPESPYIEGLQRFSLRDRIFREVVLNFLIHREYSSAFPASITIYRNVVIAENWNIPYIYGPVNPQTAKPHRKNPVIANVFSQMGVVEELGSGTPRIFKYTPLYSGGELPVMEEQDIYKCSIPYMSDTTQTTTQTTTQKIVEMMRQEPSISIAEIAKRCGITRDGVNYYIRKMKSDGILNRVGSDNGGYWQILK